MINPDHIWAQLEGYSDSVYYNEIHTFRVGLSFFEELYKGFKIIAIWKIKLKK